MQSPTALTVLAIYPSPPPDTIDLPLGLPLVHGYYFTDNNLYAAACVDVRQVFTVESICFWDYCLPLAPPVITEEARQFGLCSLLQLVSVSNGCFQHIKLICMQGSCTLFS